ncbi:MAG: hypothetical protein ACPGUD_01660 [Parashewanella sp.]
MATSASGSSQQVWIKWDPRERNNLKQNKPSTIEYKNGDGKAIKYQVEIKDGAAEIRQYRMLGKGTQCEPSVKDEILLYLLVNGADVFSDEERASLCNQNLDVLSRFLVSQPVEKAKSMFTAFINHPKESSSSTEDSGFEMISITTKKSHKIPIADQELRRLILQEPSKVLGFIQSLPQDSRDEEMSRVQQLVSFDDFQSSLVKMGLGKINREALVTLMGKVNVKKLWSSENIENLQSAVAKLDFYIALDVLELIYLDDEKQCVGEIVQSIIKATNFPSWIAFVGTFEGQTPKVYHAFRNATNSSQFLTDLAAEKPNLLKYIYSFYPDSVKKETIWDVALALEEAQHTEISWLGKVFAQVEAVPETEARELVRRCLSHCTGNQNQAVVVLSMIVEHLGEDLKSDFCAVYFEELVNSSLSDETKVGLLAVISKKMPEKTRPLFRPLLFNSPAVKVHPEPVAHFVVSDSFCQQIKAKQPAMNLKLALQLSHYLPKGGSSNTVVTALFVNALTTDLENLSQQFLEARRSQKVLTLAESDKIELAQMPSLLIAVLGLPRDKSGCQRTVVEELLHNSDSLTHLVESLTIAYKSLKDASLGDQAELESSLHWVEGMIVESIGDHPMPLKVFSKLSEKSQAKYLEKRIKDDLEELSAADPGECKDEITPFLYAYIKDNKKIPLTLLPALSPVQVDALWQYGEQSNAKNNHKVLTQILKEKAGVSPSFVTQLQCKNEIQQRLITKLVNAGEVLKGRGNKLTEKQLINIGTLLDAEHQSLLLSKLPQYAVDLLKSKLEPVSHE